MRFATACTAVALGLIAVAPTACSEPNSAHQVTIDRKSVSGLPTVTTTEYAKVNVTVEAVDYEDRSIALTGPNGKTGIFTVSPAVRNFRQIKKGDVVKVEYATMLAASVRKVGGQLPASSSTVIVPAELGQKPGVLCTRNARIEAAVESIDYTTRLVKLRTAAGDPMVFTASRELKDLDNVHAGDQVVFDYAEALSITVD